MACLARGDVRIEQVHVDEGDAGAERVASETTDEESRQGHERPQLNEQTRPKQRLSQSRSPPQFDDRDDRVHDQSEHDASSPLSVGMPARSRSNPEHTEGRLCS
jgi:hypothetical protein